MRISDDVVSGFDRGYSEIVNHVANGLNEMTAIAGDIIAGAACEEWDRLGRRDFWNGVATALNRELEAGRIMMT